jgi:hypothetical protein
MTAPPLTSLMAGRESKSSTGLVEGSSGGVNEKKGRQPVMGGGPFDLRGATCRTDYGRRIACVLVPALKIWPPDAL